MRVFLVAYSTNPGVSCNKAALYINLLIVKPCQPPPHVARLFLNKINQQANYLAKEAAQKQHQNPVTFSCYKHEKKLPLFSVVLWKFIIEMSLISRSTLLTIRFTVLLQDVTR
jgi:hypothetical protein